MFKKQKNFKKEIEENDPLNILIQEFRIGSSILPKGSEDPKGI